MLDGFIDFILRFRKAIIVVFVLFALFGGGAYFFVKVNYNMADYLPPDALSTRAIELMQEEFDGALPNANVLVKDVSIGEALDYKEQLSTLEGVSGVVWLDDTVDIREPLETLDPQTVETFYKDGNALFTVTVAEGAEPRACGAIRALVGEKGALSGTAPDLVGMQEATNSEVMAAILILLPIIILILILATTSWIEPLLFLATVGVAILINMGTNLIVGEVSFVTNAVSPILQLAVSLDYAVFMLHSFASFRKEYESAEVAMRHAVRASLKTIAASGATTLFGFMALTFMDFQIGADLGMSLMKGIVFSFIASIVFLPALTLCSYPAIDKSSHRLFIPATNNIFRFFSKLAIPAIVVVALIVAPAFLGQGQTEFVYGNSYENDTQTSRDRRAVRDEFGQSTLAAILVPRGDPARELQVSKELEDLEHVTSVMSYAATVGTGIPSEFLDESVTGQFYSPNYARIIAYTDTPDEGDLAFKTVEEMAAVVDEYYGGEYYMLGQSANLYDMRETVTFDNQLVTLLAILSIFLVLIVAFRSASLPFILLLTIEVGIWVNLAIPYFMGVPINFLGYLIVNTVQLGATVDYAILLTTTYLRYRKELPRKEAMHKAMGSSFLSILVSASTLSAAGFVLYATSSNPSVSDVGLLLGRGTILSVVMVTCFLPAMLRFFDKPIAKTTYKAAFFLSAGIGVGIGAGIGSPSALDSPSADPAGADLSPAKSIHIEPPSTDPEPE